MGSAPMMLAIEFQFELVISAVEPVRCCLRISAFEKLFFAWCYILAATVIRPKGENEVRSLANVALSDSLAPLNIKFANASAKTIGHVRPETKKP